MIMSLTSFCNVQMHENVYRYQSVKFHLMMIVLFFYVIIQILNSTKFAPMLKLKIQSLYSLLFLYTFIHLDLTEVYGSLIFNAY